MKGKRLLSLLLCLVMVLGMLPGITLSASALDDTKPTIEKRIQPLQIYVNMPADKLTISNPTMNGNALASYLEEAPKGVYYTGNLNAAATVYDKACNGAWNASLKQGVFTNVATKVSGNDTYYPQITIKVLPNAKLDSVTVLTASAVGKYATDGTDVSDKVVLSERGEDNTYTLTFNQPDAYNAVARVNLHMSKTEIKSYNVTYHYGGATIVKKYTEGDEALPTPDSADLTEASAGTLYYTNIDGWYRDANFTGEAVDLTTFKPDANVDFYAKTSLKDGITMPIAFAVPTYGKIMKPVQGARGEYERFTFYNPNVEGKLIEATSKEGERHFDYSKLVLQVPVEKPLGSMYPGTGNLKTLFAGTSFYLPSSGGDVTGWHFVAALLNYKYHNKTVTADTVIPLELAIAYYETQGQRPLYIQVDQKMYCTAIFHANLEGVTDPARYEFTVTDAGGGAPKDWNTAANAWAKEQEQKNPDKLFRGWYLDSACTDEMKYEWVPDLDIELYAKWVDPCKVTFDMNGVVNVSNADKFTERTVGVGDLLQDPGVPPTVTTTTADAIAFDGWYTTADYKEGTKWDFGKNKVEEDTILYAKWNAARWVDVTFRTYSPDDIGKDNPMDTTVKVPVAEGYQFGPLPAFPHSGEKPNVDVGTTRTLTYNYWKFEKRGFPETLTATTDLSTKLDEGATKLLVTADTTPSFTFTFDTDGGTHIDPQVKTGDSAKATQPAEPSKEGCEFAGWYKDKNCTQGFSFDDLYQVNTTIYAKWKEPTRYKLIFDCTDIGIDNVTIELKNGDTVVPETKREGSKITYSLLAGTYSFTISAPGYKTQRQAEWVIDENTALEYTYQVKLEAFKPVTGIKLSSTDLMQRGTYNLNELATVEPAAASSKEPITWSVAEGKTLPAGVTLDGTTLTVTKDAPAGAKIELTASVAGGILGSDNATAEPFQQSITLTVTQYLPLVTFANGSGDHPNTVTLPEAVRVNTDMKLTAPTAPACDGWNFKGWYKDKACSDDQLWKFETDTAQDDLTLYAKWEQEAKEVTVTYTGDGGTANTGAQTSVTGKKSGDEITLLPNMFTKSEYLFRAWRINDGQSKFAGVQHALAGNTELKAVWTKISEAITTDDLDYALRGVTAENAESYKPQLLAARDALAAGTATRTNETWINRLDELFTNAKLVTVSLSGDASTGMSQKGAILSAATVGGTVKVDLSNVAAPAYTLPEAYQNSEYQVTWRKGTLTIDGTTRFAATVPVTITMPVPSELAKMATDTIRVLVYKDSASEPAILTPKLVDGKLQFTLNAFSHMAFVGKEISDAKDTRVTALVMKYKGNAMGHVTQDANGNFTVTLPSTTNESTLQDLLLGTDWVTYMTVAPQASVTPEGAAAQTAETWANTGVRLEYDLKSANNYSKTRNFTVTAGDGTTTRTFTVTVKKITDADRTYKIAVANISGGTVTAKPNPAAAGEEVKLTIEPNDGKKLIAGSLSYCLQSAGAKSEPINETTLTFIMPAGDININAQFEDDASAPIKNPPQITAFMINGVSAVINHDTKAITIILPYGTDLKHVAPTIVTANASKVEPSSAQRVNLSTPKAYRVYASNGAYVTYTVTAYTEEPSPTQSLWEKLQNQINSNPNWWELAEYQKKTGYYK